MPHNPALTANFDGTNYIEIPYNAALNTPKFTVSVWAYTQQSVHAQRMFDNFNNITTRHGYSVAFNSSDNKYGFYIEDGSTSYGAIHSNEIELNRWYHFVFQYDGTKRIIYENGVKLVEIASGHWEIIRNCWNWPEIAALCPKLL